MSEDPLRCTFCGTVRDCLPPRQFVKSPLAPVLICEFCVDSIVDMLDRPAPTPTTECLSRMRRMVEGL